jgi:hypothetical protein
MHDAGAVSGTKRVGDLRREGDGLRQRQRPASDHLLEGLAFEQFHDHVTEAVRRGADVEERTDVRMGEPGDRARLALEPFTQRGGIDPFGIEDLDSDRAAKARVTGPIDGAGTARPERSLDVVRPETHPWRDHRRNYRGA